MHPDLAFEVWSGERQRRVEDVLERVLPRTDVVPDLSPELAPELAPELTPHRLHEAMRYAVLGGGKRIRPLLAYAAGEFAEANPVDVDAVMLEIVKEFPPAFRPSIVTLSAPFKSIIGCPAVVAAVIVLAAPPAGRIMIDVYEAGTIPLALSTLLAAASVVLPQTSIAMAPV